MKLKSLLEGYAWERKDGQPLPTLNDVRKIHEESESDISPRGDDSYTKMDANPTGEQLAEDIYDAINNINSSMSYQDLAFAVARVLEDSYGTHNYDRFVSELKSNLDKMRD